VEQLKISDDEAAVFLAIVNRGKMNSSKLSEALGWKDFQKATICAKSLVDKGMMIEINPSEFESLHPRFAITNRYRKYCEANGIPFKKNTLIDNIGVLLEKPYEDARTK
jgi:hypothetical protein